MRARGLKLIANNYYGGAQHVAPHAGAWIETQGDCASLDKIVVAPHAGAWIETLISFWSLRLATVAPHAGAWIETIANLPDAEELASRPMRARGLKH